MVPLVVFLVATSMAIEEGDTSSSSSLLMMKSFTKKAKSVSEEDQSLNGMASMVMSLAERSASGAPLTGEEKEALQSIKDFIEKLHITIDTQHVEDQHELWRINYEIGNCSTDAATALAGPVLNFDNSMQSKREQHAECRTLEGQQKIKMDYACSQYDGYRKTNANAPAPDCLKTVAAIVGTSDSIKRDRLGNCLEETKVWFDPLYALYLDCNNNYGDHAAERKACGKSQTNFEKTFCSYKIKLGDTCDEQDRCRARNIKTRDTVHKDLANSEIARKADYKTGTTVLCYFNVFEADDKDKAKILAECSKAKIDTKKYNLVYPGVPDPNACTRKPTGPCDEYTGAQWQTNAEASECGPCN